MNRSLASAASRDRALELARRARRRRARSAASRPALDDLGQLALLLGGEERDLADLVEVLTDRITHVCTWIPNEP